jgi:hypothetical protein
MEPFGALLVAAVGAAVGILVQAWQSERREESWTRVADDLGLASRSWRRSWLGPTGLSGTTPEGAVVEIAERGAGNSRQTELSVGVPGQIPAWVHLTNENFGTAFSRAFGERDLEVGDPAFDVEVAVHGDAGSAVAALTQEARLAARALIRDGYAVHNGTVHFTFRRGTRDAAEIVVAARRAIWLAGLLASKETIPRRLAAQASGDPVPGVRRRALERLADGFAELPETAAALAAALGDLSPTVRAFAASRLGAAGESTLFGLLSDAQAADGVVVEALAALGSRLPAERAVALLASGAPRRGAAVLAAAAGSLATPAGPGAEEALVGLLGHEEREVRLAVAAALGRVGTTAAVAPLRAVVAAHPLDLGLRGGASEAIAAIQARADGAAPGQLALAGGEAGTLTLADDHGSGRVALAEGGKGPASPEQE